MKDAYLVAVIIFTEKQTNRLLYVLHFICTDWARVPYRVTASADEFAAYEGAKINYSRKAVCKDEIHIVPCLFLDETAHRFFMPVVTVSKETTLLFPTEQAPAGVYHFDVFAAVFYLISRYEEYGNKTKDKWGRFPAKESLACAHHFLQKPMVDIWLTELMKAITARHPAFIVNRKTTVSFTYDIDVAYAYKGREIIRQAGSAVKDVLRIKPYNLAQRTAVLAGYLEDPFDTYDYIRQETINPVVFFLLSKQKTKYDHNINPKKELLKTLIRKVATWSPVGIHPSFYSSEKRKKITTEKKTLEAILAHPVTKSRQHYLKFTVPQTYRDLYHNGITEDYSLSFAEMPGFRAGTCTPFYFFDIEKNEVTPLKLYPACIMESTFRDDIIIPVKEVLPYFIQYFEEVNKVNGHFISIWHNDTLAANNKQHFRWLHQQILQYIRSRIKE